MCWYPGQIQNSFLNLEEEIMDIARFALQEKLQNGSQIMFNVMGQIRSELGHYGETILEMFFVENDGMKVVKTILKSLG